MEFKEEKIRRIKKEINELNNSPLVEFRKKNKYKLVIGEGSLDAKVMFVGEAPGENEAREGWPFIGMAGEKLDELLDNIGIKREEIYITETSLEN